VVFPCAGCATISAASALNLCCSPHSINAFISVHLRSSVVILTFLDTSHHLSPTYGKPDPQSSQNTADDIPPPDKTPQPAQSPSQSAS
jgi:energy-converting hydrogenase Eha subunit F